MEKAAHPLLIMARRDVWASSPAQRTRYLWLRTGTLVGLWLACFVVLGWHKALDVPWSISIMYMPLLFGPSRVLLSTLLERHVLLQDADGAVRLERQWCWRGRVLSRRQVDLAPYTWMRVGAPSEDIVELQLGNPQYQTRVLAGIYSVAGRVKRADFEQQAGAGLVALGDRLEALTGIRKRGYSSLY